jgi:hypothetical protein
MSYASRLKTLLGGKGNLKTLASAATLTIPDSDNAFFVSGTTAITSLLVTGGHVRNRKVAFIGASGASVLFTNTNTPTTAGQMELRGVDRTISADTVLELYCKSDGTWILWNSTI